MNEENKKPKGHYQRYWTGSGENKKEVIKWVEPKSINKTPDTLKNLTQEIKKIRGESLPNNLKVLEDIKIVVSNIESLLKSRFTNKENYLSPNRVTFKPVTKNLFVATPKPKQSFPIANIDNRLINTNSDKNSLSPNPREPRSNKKFTTEDYLREILKVQLKALSLQNLQVKLAAQTILAIELMQSVLKDSFENSSSNSNDEGGDILGIGRNQGGRRPPRTRLQRIGRRARFLTRRALPKLLKFGAVGLAALGIINEGVGAWKTEEDIAEGIKSGSITKKEGTVLRGETVGKFAGSGVGTIFGGAFGAALGGIPGLILGAIAGKIIGGFTGSVVGKYGTKAWLKIKKMFGYEDKEDSEDAITPRQKLKNDLVNGRITPEEYNKKIKTLPEEEEEPKFKMIDTNVGDSVSKWALAIGANVNKTIDNKFKDMGKSSKTLFNADDNNTGIGSFFSELGDSLEKSIKSLWSTIKDKLSSIFGYIFGDNKMSGQDYEKQDIRKVSTPVPRSLEALGAAQKELVELSISQGSKAAGGAINSTVINNSNTNNYTPAPRSPVRNPEPTFNKFLENKYG